MIDPSSGLSCITVEGSKHGKLSGEYVIDIAEYYDSKDEGPEVVIYYQLKHSTVRVNQSFTLSELKGTITGFAERFKDHKKKKLPSQSKYVVTTNRGISSELKQCVVKLARGESVSARPLKGLQNATGLGPRNLKQFCQQLSFVDDEGDYKAQKLELRGEVAEYIVGFVDSDHVDHIIQLVADHALPESEGGTSDGKITRENVLKKLRVTSSHDLFPAPPKFESVEHLILRDEHHDILDQITNGESSVILHAEGGVGKSVFAQQLVESLPENSKGVLYDCFGGGFYRNSSQPRHEPSQATLQIANELAKDGLCKHMIPLHGATPDYFYREFLTRIRQSVESLKQIDPEAFLLIVIDAADNAEMIADERGQRCFANELLQESMPAGCKLVMTCRPERKHLLKASSRILDISLPPFSKDETWAHLRSKYDEATQSQGEEFYRLSGGNPRVQAYALNQSASNSVIETLSDLGPRQTTVDEQIAVQLRSAVNRVRDLYGPDVAEEADSICRGLANLPPLIPLNILARAANVSEESIRSFASELGRSLWLSENSVLFRDEPTETWFRNTYAGSREQISEFIRQLEPISSDFAYVARALPELLLKANQYDELIRQAVSDQNLPEDDTIDSKSILLYRLRFALKASLGKNDLKAAAQITLRFGEELAGNERQLTLLKSNLDLIAPLLESYRAQELAFQSVFKSGWGGSENVFSASLLSSLEELKGDSRAYLRSAENWLDLYFEDRKREQEDDRPVRRELLTNDDIAEIHWTIFNASSAETVGKFPS